MTCTEVNQTLSALVNRFENKEIRVTFQEEDFYESTLTLSRRSMSDIQIMFIPGNKRPSMWEVYSLNNGYPDRLVANFFGNEIEQLVAYCLKKFGV